MPDLTATDLLVAAAIIDARGLPHLRPLADRLSQAAAERAETDTTSSDPTPEETR